MSEIAEFVFQAFIVLLFSWWGFVVVRERIAVRRFVQRFRGKWLLVCSRRHGWYDFIKNNVEPVLPEGVCLVWTGLQRGEEGSDPSPRLLRALGATGERPFLFHVDSRSSVPVHDDLQKLRATPKRDAAAQERIHTLLDGCVRSER